MVFDQNIVKELKQFVKINGSNGMKIKKFLEKNLNIEEYIETILKQYPNFKNKGNIIWSILNDFDIDKYVCKTCKKPLKMTHATQLIQYCNAKCAATDPEYIKKRKETIAKDPEYWKKRQQKIQQTNLKKYGCIAPAQNENVKMKMKQTWAENPNMWKDRNEKIKQTNLEKYGVQNTYMLKNSQQNSKITKSKQTYQSFLKFKHLIEPLFTEEYFIQHSKQKLEWKCLKCGNIFKQENKHTSIDNQFYNLPRCPKCLPKFCSKFEFQIKEYIKTIYIGQIKQNDKEIIKPLELDIVLPELKLAIECNGIHWHSTGVRKDKNYHLNKTELCQKAGYRLIHIFEYEWQNKQYIIKQKLKSIICKDIPSIYGRKCQIKQINSKLKNEFLNVYHIQGQDKSNVKLGLYFNQQLIGVMTFCKPRFNKNYEYQLSRYATSKRVIGGASKLLKYFQKHYNPKSIITYADRRYSIGNLYYKLGFKLDHISQPNYFWTKNNQILTRYQCQKHKLKQLLGQQNYSQNLTENQNMKLNGWNKIFDCGNYVFIK